jgi:hypothetical protein
MKNPSRHGASFDPYPAPDSNNLSRMSCTHAFHANAQVAPSADVIKFQRKIGIALGSHIRLSTRGVVAMSSRSMSSHSQIAPVAEATPIRSPAPPLLRRFYDAIVAGKRVRAEQEVARYLLTHRDKLTDSLEREIERRFQRG